MAKVAPVPFASTVIRVNAWSFDVAFSMYSNLLHLIVSMNGKPGVLALYTPNSKLGNDSNATYNVKELMGRLTRIQGLVLKQIAATPVLEERGIPLLCNLMTPTDLSVEDTRILLTGIQSFLQSHADLILHSYKRSF
ncbi:hypothetical protein WA588_001300 [Blastocystis sp. NMH]